MTAESLIAKIRAGQKLDFATTLAVIDSCYEYTPVAFSNGLEERRIVNLAGENEGSCKVFAFANLHGLTEQETLTLFGEHYQHVLATPTGDDHRNIRTFMQDGWAGIHFDQPPLKARR